MDKIEALKVFYTIPAEVNLYRYHSNIYLLLITTYYTLNIISFRKI